MEPSTIMCCSCKGYTVQLTICSSGMTRFSCAAVIARHKNHNRNRDKLCGIFKVRPSKPNCCFFCYRYMTFHVASRPNMGTPENKSKKVNKQMTNLYYPKKLHSTNGFDLKDPYFLLTMITLNKDLLIHTFIEDDSVSS